MRGAESYVVLADVVESREVDDRNAFRDDLVETLEYVNETHSESIRTPFEPIKGIDEFGGVLDELAPICEVLSDVLNGLHPVSVRFGVAGGRVDVNETANAVAEMDGPAFHQADRLLSRAEGDEVYAYVDTDQPTDVLVSSTINLLLMYREHWTDRQVEVVRSYERYGTQSDAADELGVRQQAVSESLKRAGYNRTRRIRSQLRETLEILYDD